MVLMKVHNVWSFYNFRPVLFQKYGEIIIFRISSSSLNISLFNGYLYFIFITLFLFLIEVLIKLDFKKMFSKFLKVRRATKRADGLTYAFDYIIIYSCKHHTKSSVNSLTLNDGVILFEEEYLYFIFKNDRLKSG